jgi:hypothetical protein
MSKNDNENVKMTPWLDASAYGVRFNVVRLPRGDKKVPLLAMVQTSADATEAFDAMGAALGFRRIPLPENKGHFYLKTEGGQINISSLRKTLHEAGYDQVGISSLSVSEVFREAKKSTPEKTAAQPAAEAAPAQSQTAPDSAKAPEKKAGQGGLWDEGEDIPLKEGEYLRKDLNKFSTVVTRNAHLEDVREFKDGENKGKRFVAKFARPGVVELDVEGDPRFAPRLMLASDEAALRSLVGDLAARIREGDVLTQDDLVEFAKLVFRDDFTEESVERVAVALDNDFSRWMRHNADLSMSDLFQSASTFQERMVYSGKRPDRDDNLANLTFPLSVILHRISASLATEDAKAVFVNPGNGSLFAKWKKLGPESQIKIFETRPDLAEAINFNGRELGLRRTERVQTGTPEYDNADAIVANVQVGWADKVETRYGFQFMRREFIDILDALEARSADGNAIFSFPLEKDDSVSTEMAQFMEILGRHYAVEGVAEVDSSVHKGISGQEKLALVAVNNKRPEPLDKAPEPSLRRREVFTFGELYNWSSEVITSRKKISDYLATLEANDSPDKGEDAANRNEFQAPYVPASKCESGDNRVPRMLEAAMRKAMARLLAKHSDVDEYVLSKLPYESFEELNSHLSAEQVDALAAAMFAQERGYDTFLLADQTGIGKGRTAAALALWHLWEFRKPIMMTKSAININDVLRDLADTGAIKHCTPLIINGNVAGKPYTYIDPETGEEREVQGMTEKRFKEEFCVAEPAFDAEGEPILDANGDQVMNYRVEIPEDSEYNLLIGTYSQFSGNLEKCREEDPNSLKTLKLEFWEQFVTDESVLIMDEAQAATGKGNTGKNMRAAMEKAYSKVPISATHARDAETLGFFIGLFPDYINEETLKEVAQKGGETALEVITTALAERGVFMRREHDSSRDIHETIIDIENWDRNRAIADAVSPILASVAFLSGDLKRRIRRDVTILEQQLERGADELEAARMLAGGQNNDEVRQIQAQIGRQRRRVKSLKGNTLSVGSPNFRIRKVLDSALLANVIAKKSIEDIQEGRKPTTVVDSTLSALYEELYKRQQEEGLEVTPMVTLSDFITRELEMIFAKLEEGIEGNDGANLVTPEELAQKEGLLQMARELPHMHISLIDELRRQISEAGYRVDEITGRRLMHDGTKVVIREKNNGEKAKAFNYGRLDSLLLNKSGLTGISIDDDEKYDVSLDDLAEAFDDEVAQNELAEGEDGSAPRSGGQRTMNMGDTPLEGDTFKQAFGRISRKNTRTPAIYRNYISGIPVAAKLVMIENSKQRRPACVKGS